MSLLYHRVKPIIISSSSAAADAATALLLHRGNRRRRSFRSEAAIEALRSSSSSSHNESNKKNSLLLYNYPALGGAYAALFARNYHYALRVPFLLLPFSSVLPLRLQDFERRGGGGGGGSGFETCYLLDLIGPDNFAIQLSQIIPRVVAFDHRQSSAARISQFGQIPDNVELHIDTSKCSARAVRDYFLKKIKESTQSPSEEENAGLLNCFEGRDQVENVLKYVEDADLRRFKLPDVEAFKIAIREEMAKLNCVTNPHVFEQILEIDCKELIARGNAYADSRREAANKLLDKAFKIRLGRGAYGECLAVRADGISDLSHEMCLELSRRSAVAGLRPIGAAVYMQRRNLKMCLRSTDTETNTSEIAKAYGGGGKPSSSSFIIRMDEYNHWTAVS